MAKTGKILKLLFKILGYTLGGIVGLVVLVLVAINFLLDTGFFSRFVLDQALPPVEKAICANIEVDSLRLRLLPFRLEIKGARYTDPENKYPYPFATLDRLYVKVKTLPLLAGRVEVSDLSLEGVTNYLLLDKGLANLPLCPSEPEPEEPEKESEEPFKLDLPIKVDQLHLDAKFRMDIASETPEPTEENPEPTPSTPLNATVGAINLDGRADLHTGDVHAELRMADGSFLFGELYDKLDKLAIDADANLQSWTANVTKLEVNLPDVALKATAEAKDLLGEMELAAKLGVDVDLRKVNQLFLKEPQDMQLRGALNLETTAGLKLGKEKMTYSAAGAIRLPEAAVNELALRNFTAEFTADQDQAALKSFHVETADGAVDLNALVGLGEALPLSAQVAITSLDVGQALREFGMKDLPVAALVDAELSARGDLSPLKLDAQGLIDLADVGYGGTVKVKRVNINLDATTRGAENQVRELKVIAHDIAAGGSTIPQATVLLQGDVGPTLNKIKTLQVNTPHTKVLVAGVANLQGGLDLTAAVDLGDLSEFQGFVGDKELTGRGGLSAKVGGTVKNPDVQGKLGFHDIRFDKIRVDSLLADLGFADQKAEIKNLKVESGAAAIALDASYDMKPEEPALTAKVSLPETQIADLLALAGMQDKLEIDGATSLTVDVRGPLKHLNGEVSLAGDKLEAFGEKVERINLATRLDGGEVIIDDLSIVKNRGIRPVFSRGLWKAKPDEDITDAEKEPAKITLTGRVNPFEKTFDVKLRTTNLNEMASDTVVKEKIHAMADVDLNADLSGSFDNINGGIRLAILKGRYEHLDLGDSSIDVTIRDQRVVVTGELLADRNPVIQEEAKTALLAEPSGGETDDDGGDPDFETPPGPEKPAVNLGSIRINATLGLDGEMPLDAKVVFDKFDYSTFLKSRDEVKKQIKGKKGKPDRLDDKEEEKIFAGLLDGAITITGNLSKPEAEATPGAEPAAAPLAVIVRFDELLFQQNEFIVRNQDERGQTVPLEIHYANGELAVPSFSLGGPGLRLRLTKDELRGESYFVLDGDVELNVASAFTEALAEATGKLVLHAEIPVAFDLDKVTATAVIRQANFVVQNVPSAIENFNFELDFANRVATIKALEADIGGGRLHGGGTYKLPPKEAPAAETTTPEGEAAALTKEEKKARAAKAEAAKPKAQMDIFIKLSDIKTAYDPYLELALKKVDLILSTRPDGKLDISGDVEIAKAAVTYDVDLPTILKAFQKPKGGASGSEVYEKKEESVFLNIGIRADRNLLFENNLAQIELKADLLLTGSNVDLGMIGTVYVIKGHAQVWNNDYKLTSAVIQFVDETRIFPAFDINARTEVRDNQIFVNVSGTPERYQVSLMSDPPMTERDIVALLSVGVSYEEFQTSGSGISGDQAMAIAAQQLLGSQLTTYTGLEFGVDNSRGQPLFAASTSLEKDLKATLFRAISDPTLAAELEYSFVRYMAVYTEWSNFAAQENPPSSGGFGAGLRLKLEFR
ncbi:MAG: hypothetical protein GX444_12745 [Myxococcales bacterium]|nr:hypothetical protein [Myxococcales bacterium]